MGTCLDLGTTFSAGGIPTAPFTIDQQVSTNADPNFNPLGNEAYWVIRNKDHLNTSWAQDSTDTYFSGVPKRIGKSDAEGGRSGYSVKIVSRRFLNRTDLPFGSMEPDNVIKGPIKNPPAAMPQNL